jgi:hypothetical protein
VARRSILDAADVQDKDPAAQAAEEKPAASGTPGTAVAVPGQAAAAQAQRLREQPFSLSHWSATLPERDVTEEEATGPLTAQEQEQLTECHRAIDNARTAAWLLGRSLEIVRRRRLYRGDGSRTWEQYLTAEHDGMSKRDARRLMDEWRLAKAVQDQLGKPAPASHVRAMLDYADNTSDAQAAVDYALLHNAFAAGRVRLAAHQVSARVSHAIESAATERDPQQRQSVVTAHWQEVHAPQQPALARQRTDEQPQAAAQRLSAADPVSGATFAVEEALERLDKALMDEGAALRRAAVDAEHLQKRLRKVGRILAKVTVPADDVVEAEIVADDEAQG